MNIDKSILILFGGTLALSLDMHFLSCGTWFSRVLGGGALGLPLM